MLSFVEVLSVAVEVVVYLDVCSVGRLTVASTEVGQTVKECKLGAEQVLLECRRLVWTHRALAGRDLVVEVASLAAGSRTPVCDLVALGRRVGHEVRIVKKLILAVGNKLTELLRWCGQRCVIQARGVVVEGQLGAYGRTMYGIRWPRVVWGGGMWRADDAGVRWVWRVGRPRRVAWARGVHG